MTIKTKIFTNKRSFTITELLIVSLGIIILAGVSVNLFTLGLNLWSEGYSRSDIRTELSQAFELVSKNLRLATSIDTLTVSSITFTADLGSGSSTYMVYLYNADDRLPIKNPYSEDFYDLRWTSGSTYGTGQIIASDIAKPTNTPFSQSNNLISIDLTVTRGDESVRMKTNVRPTNL